MERVSYWSPRILGILFALFVSAFALDVFGEHQGFWTTILALLIHLIPAAIVALALVLSWRWERLGSALFFALAAFYMVLSRGRMVWTAYAVIAGPLLLIGALFLVDSLRRRAPLPHA